MFAILIDFDSYGYSNRERGGNRNIIKTGGGTYDFLLLGYCLDIVWISRVR
jgi:hypothetical protein